MGLTHRSLSVALPLALLALGCDSQIVSHSGTDAQPGLDAGGGSDGSQGSDAQVSPDGPLPDGLPPDGSPLDGSLPQEDGGVPPTAFRFVAWGDTKSGTSVLIDLSTQAKAFNPAFTLYAGDLVSSGFPTSSADAWKTAVNGASSNGMFDITFPVRGNHEGSGSTSAWQAYFDLAGVATRVGATSYSELQAELTYSFDYGNAHFVGVDVLGDATAMTSAELAWLDQDLTAAEGRGLTHAFLFWHGPIYPVGGHCCPTAPNIIDVLNGHPIVSATFHGHEHNLAWVNMDTLRYSNLTHGFEQFVIGAAGAGLYACQSGRSDWCQSTNGFGVVDVDGNQFTVSIYEQGNATPIFQDSFTK
ncbi:MAG: metallophosphoesterase [Deltaproteobacteria bacterium]|nr:metallophosphoesterase [Deltaproteobacteria bacterium]